MTLRYLMLGSKREREDVALCSNNTMSGIGLSCSRGEMKKLKANVDGFPALLCHIRCLL